MKSITNKYLKSLYTNIGAELEELVFKVELLPHTTKNNYGRYMGLLTMLQPQVGLDNAVQLLIMAKGNKEGILDAKKVLEG
jgi:hypothetical protein